MKNKLDIYSFLTDVPEEPKPQPIKEEVVETPVEPKPVEPTEYKFKFKEVVAEEKKNIKRNIFEFLVSEDNSVNVESVIESFDPSQLLEIVEEVKDKVLLPPEPLTLSQVETPKKVQEKFSQSDVDGLEKFADRILAKYDIDVEFTRHFVDRLNDPRNNPEIKVAELQRFFKKIQKNKGKDIRKNPDVEVVLKDLASDINLPVVINYKNGEFEVVNKTVMRKKDFKTPNKVIQYEINRPSKDDQIKEQSKRLGINTSVVDDAMKLADKSLQAYEEENMATRIAKKLHDDRHRFDQSFDAQEVKPKTEVDILREELNLLKKSIATQFGKMDYGSGETKLQWLDDIDRTSARVDGKYLRYSAATGMWGGADAEGDNQNGIEWQAVKTDDFTAISGEGYFINTTSQAITMTLPAAPALGDEVAIIDYAGTANTNNITIDRNGNLFNGVNQNITVDTARAAFKLVFTDGTQGWVLTNK
jgi:hypothetical protein